MKKFFARALGYAVSAIFVFGLWSFGHFILKASDFTLMTFAWWLIFLDLATFINKPDDKTS